MDYSTKIKDEINRIMRMGWAIRVIRISEEVNEGIIIKAYLQTDTPEGLGLSEEEAFKIAKKKIAGKKLTQLFGYPVEIAKGLINWTFGVSERNYNTL